MTATQTPPVPFGRHLGTAARTARALLDDVLAAEATTYETWIAFNLLATGEPGIQREDFAHNLAAALQVNNGAAISQLLGQLELFGLIHTDPASANTRGLVELTAEGAAQYQRLLAAVNRQSARVLGSIDPNDVQTTIRVLGQFREQAEALLSS